MKELMIIQEKLNAPKSLRNDFWKYNYRSAETILEAVKPLLKETKTILLLSDEIIREDNRFYIKATAKLINEEWKEISVTWYAREEEAKKGMDWSQITWASSSYARKYALNWLFAIDDEKDSDATNTHWKDSKQEKKEVVTDKKWFNIKDDNHLEEIRNKILQEWKTPQDFINWLIKAWFSIWKENKEKILNLF